MTKQLLPDPLSGAPDGPTAILHDTNLLALCRQNDAEAWRRLYMAGTEIIRGIAWHMGVSADAEDICQERG